MSAIPLVHLVRHGEVYNPDHVVYGSRPGFGLSADGRAEAAAAAARLARREIGAVVASPLERAVTTARAIALPHGLEVATDGRLGEWALGDRWFGISWEELPYRFPGELEAYRERPHDLPFAPESIAEVAVRMRAAIVEHRDALPAGELVVVSHQDPIQAVRLALCGRSLERLLDDKPAHAEVITLMPGEPWREVERWTPSVHPPPPQ